MGHSDPSVIQMAIQPYLFFGGRCEEALQFYTKVLNAKVDMLMRFADAPVTPDTNSACAPSADFAQKIMHSSFRIRGTTLMASDGIEPDSHPFKGFSLSLSVRDTDDANRTFNALADGGKIIMPLGPTFWSSYFGMLTDRFGIGWMIGIPQELDHA